MSENLIERYLTDIGEVRGTGSNVPETSFYPALERLLSDLGKTLSPKVRCVINLAKIPDDLKHIAVFQRMDGKPAKPEAGDLDLTAGWGHGGKGGVTMPGRGKSVRHDDGSLDVFLNDIACWRNVPEAVWNYTIGGYQVIKKWLSYREKPLLGRSLTPDEVRYVTEMVRRLAALIALQPSLDANYRSATKETYSWTNSATAK
jgi:hypothetical protein